MQLKILLLLTGSSCVDCIVFVGKELDAVLILVIALLFIDMPF